MLGRKEQKKKKTLWLTNGRGEKVKERKEGKERKESKGNG